MNVNFLSMKNKENKITDIIRCDNILAYYFNEKELTIRILTKFGWFDSWAKDSKNMKQTMKSFSKLMNRTSLMKSKFMGFDIFILADEVESLHAEIEDEKEETRILFKDTLEFLYLEQSIESLFDSY